MTESVGLKDQEGLFDELDALFSDKERLINEDWYSRPEFREAIIETILDHLDKAESE